MGLSVVGAAASLGFVVVFTLDGWTRRDYAPRHHTVSALALGPRGWLQTLNFILCGAAIAVAGPSVMSASTLVAVAVVVLGLALVASGIWRMDPMRGYPPGAPDTPPDATSRAHQLHDVAGAVVFFVVPIAAAVLALVADVEPWLRWVSGITAIVTAFLSGKFGVAWERDEPSTGMWQRRYLATGLVWLALLFLVA